MIITTCYKSSNNDNKSDNNKDKICLLLRKWDLIDHMLDHMLDHVLDYMLNHLFIGIMTTMLHVPLTILWKTEDYED